MIVRALIFLIGFFGKPQTKLPGQIIDIKAGDYFFLAPATARPGLTTIRITSVLGNHVFQLYKLDGLHSTSDLVAALSANKPHQWATNLGGSAAADTHDVATSVFLLEPGRYAFICPVHANDLQRHYMKGMFAEMTVEGKRVPGVLPHPTVEITASDYTWKFSAPLKPGRQFIRFTNAGTVPHQLKFILLKSSATEGRARAWKIGEPNLPETRETLAPLDPGGSVLAPVNLMPGDYLLQCVPQMQHGMMQRLRVR